MIDDRVANIMGEYWQGAARGVSNAVSLMIGTGVAAGLLINGKPLRGSSGVAGAVGWWLLSKRVPKHKSSRGFLEDEVSGPAIFRKTYKYCYVYAMNPDLTLLGTVVTHLMLTVSFKCLTRGSID